jgi:hypothetical protein
MERYIPAVTFLNHIGNGQYPLSLKEYIQLGVISKDFHSTSNVLLAKAIDHSWSLIGLNMSGLLLNSDFTLQGISEISLLMRAREVHAYEKMIAGFVALPVDKIFKTDKNNLKNTLDLLQMLYQFFVIDSKKQYTDTISRIVTKLLLRYVGSVMSKYPGTMEFLDINLYKTKVAEKILSPDSAVHIYDIINILKQLECIQFDKLIIPKFPDLKTFQAIVDVWDTLADGAISGKDIRFMFDPMYSAIYYYIMLISDGFIIQMLATHRGRVLVKENWFQGKLTTLCNMALYKIDMRVAFYMDLKSISFQLVEHLHSN